MSCRQRWWKLCSGHPVFHPWKCLRYAWPRLAEGLWKYWSEKRSEISENRCYRFWIKHQRKRQLYALFSCWHVWLGASGYRTGGCSFFQSSVSEKADDSRRNYWISAARPLYCMEFLHGWAACQKWKKGSGTAEKFQHSDPVCNRTFFG